jgi:hypothetical protein
MGAVAFVRAPARPGLRMLASRAFVPMHSHGGAGARAGAGPVVEMPVLERAVPITDFREEVWSASRFRRTPSARDRVHPV